jgi:hypothetical protein
MENICYSIFNTKKPNCRCNKPIFSNNLCKYHSKRKKITYFKEISNNKNIIKTNNLNINYENKIKYIQKLFRQKLLNKCVNTEDFYTLDNIHNIPPKYRFILKDNNHSYCFDIRSLNEYINNNNKRILNPYTNIKINENNLNKIKNIINLYKNDINFNVKKDVLTKEQLYNQLVLSTFQKFDNLQFIMDIKWFKNLNLIKLKNLYRVCEDIWNYRAQLTNEQKLKIVNDGRLFIIPVNVVNKFNYTKFTYLKHVILDNFNRAVSEGETDNDKKLGAMLMLTGFAEISQDVLNAYPWLSQH